MVLIEYWIVFEFSRWVNVLSGKPGSETRTHKFAATSDQYAQANLSNEWKIAQELVENEWAWIPELDTCKFIRLERAPVSIATTI